MENNQTENNQEPKPKKRVMPTHLLYISLVLMLGFHFVWPAADIIPSPWNFIGFAFVIPALWLISSSHKLFLEFQTTIRPGETTDALITEGPYRWSRNPMYLAGVFVLMSIAVILGTLTPWIGVFFFYLFMSSYFIPLEEDMLAKEFGVKYDDYKSKVRRWL